MNKFYEAVPVKLFRIPALGGETLYKRLKYTEAKDNPKAERARIGKIIGWFVEVNEEFDFGDDEEVIDLTTSDK